MANSLTAHFNNLFGSNLTHVSNAYGSRIFVSFSGTEIVIDAAKFNTDFKKVGVEIALKQNGFTATVQIGFGDYHQYRRGNAWEYMTVVDTSGNFICTNYPIAANRSFIVIKEGIKPQKYGSSNFFEDTRGKIHH
jgi:hypothetical protein